MGTIFFVKQLHIFSVLRGKEDMRKLISTMLFLTILSACIWKAGIILRPTDPDFCENQINAFHSLEENTLDVITYGSSHCWTSFDAPYYEEQTGLRTYNYGCNWQCLNTTWLFFYDSLKTQSPKRVFVEVGLADRSGYDRDVDGEIYYTRKIGNSEQKKEYLKKCLGSIKDNYERYLSYYVPFVLSHENWENLERKSFHYHPNSTQELETVNGFNVVEKNTEVNIIRYVEQEELPKESVNMLDDIVHTCKEQNIELIFYCSPMECGYQYENFMQDYANSNGVSYVGFNRCFDEAGFDETIDFADGGHLNVKGARKATEYLKGVLDN